MQSSTAATSAAKSLLSTSPENLSSVQTGQPSTEDNFFAQMFATNQEDAMLRAMSPPSSDLAPFYCIESNFYQFILAFAQISNETGIIPGMLRDLRRCFIAKVVEWTSQPIDRSHTNDILKSMSQWPRGATWFEVLMRLHFAGYSVHGCCDEFLGLKNIDNDPLYLSDIYSYVLDQLKTCNGAENLQDFQKWVSSIVVLDIQSGFLCQKFIDELSQLGHLDKSMRAGLSDQAPCDDESFRQPFDPTRQECPCAETLRIYDARYTRTKFQILESILENAPKEWSRQVVSNWMSSPDYTSVRKTLFAQNTYPLNMTHHHTHLWNLPLSIMSRAQPDTVSDLARQLQQSSAESVKVYSEVNKQWKATGSFGRTVVLLPSADTNNYLKIQAAKEDHDDFLKTTTRIKCFNPKHQYEGKSLSSDIVQIHRVYQIDNVEKQLMAMNLPEENRKSVLDLTGRGSRLAAEFSTSSNAKYENYVYNLPSNAEKLKAILRYLQDYGILWAQYVNGPPCINAFHDGAQNRSHMTFPSLQSPIKTCEGALERWNGYATDFPNIGATGMRDLWDARPADEHNFFYINRGDEKKDGDVATQKYRVLELAHACQGAILIYARCFQKDFQVSCPFSVKQVKNDLEQMLITLFSHAFSLTPSCLCQLMKEDGLIDQCAREVCYWLAHHQNKGFYVQDLRSGTINRDAYPHLPASMKGAILSHGDSKFLTDYGFHSSKSENPDECQLGAGSGRTFLTALNAMLAKLITAGISVSAVHRQNKLET